MVPVQLRQRVYEAGQSELRLSRVVIERDLGNVCPQVHTAPRIPKGQGLLAGRHVETHEQLAYSVDVENIRHVGQTSGLTELTLTWRIKTMDRFKTNSLQAYTTMITMTPKQQYNDVHTLNGHFITSTCSIA